MKLILIPNTKSFVFKESFNPVSAKTIKEYCNNCKERALLYNYFVKKSNIKNFLNK